MTPPRRTPPSPLAVMNTLLAGAVLGLPACDSGFSLVAPVEPGVVPRIVDTTRLLREPAGLDPSSTDLIAGDPDAATLLRVRKDLPPRQDANSQTIYIIAGHGDLLLDREWRPVNPGTLVYIPAGMLHAYRNKDATETVALLSRRR